MIRASRVSRTSRVTRTSSAPWPLIVPAKTSSPGALSTGSDSPVSGASLTSLWPDDDDPVERHLVARAHEDLVADADVVDRDLAFDAAAA